MPTRLVPGVIVADKFRILRTLGAGGMGVVMAARNLHTSGEVALKCIHPSGDGALSERLRREAQAAARVRHPNVVTVFDVVELEDQLLLVMELLRGKTLEQQLQLDPPSLEHLLELLRDAMDGVRAAHESGVIHRDIKPANLFLAEEPHQSRPVVKVLDFGVSKLADPETGPITQTGAFLGTLSYMSPEQLMGSRDVDHRTDIYSFGVILYEAVTGRLPFVGTPAAIISRSLTSFPPPPDSLCPDLPPQVSDLILRAMHPDATQRFDSVACLCLAVDELLKDPAVRDRSSHLQACPPMMTVIARQQAAQLAARGHTVVAVDAPAPSRGSGVRRGSATAPHRDKAFWLRITAGALLGLGCSGLIWGLLRPAPVPMLEVPGVVVDRNAASRSPELLATEPRGIDPSPVRADLPAADPELSREAIPAAHGAGNTMASDSADKEHVGVGDSQAIPSAGERLGRAEAVAPGPVTKRSPGKLPRAEGTQSAGEKTTAPSRQGARYYGF